MTFMNFHWEWFTLVCVLIGATRLLFLPLLPWRLMSTTAAATAGFILFLALPILGYAADFAIPVSVYSALVWAAYACFLAGAGTAKSLLGMGRPVYALPPPPARMVRFATGFCILWVVYRVAYFLMTDGPIRAMEVIFGGYEHVAEIMRRVESALSNQGQTLESVTERGLGYVFVCLWVVLFTRRPWWATGLWFVYVMTHLDVYFSRSGILGMAIIPLLAYLTLYRISLRWLLTVLSVIAVVVVVFFSWNAAVRLGHDYELTSQTVVADTIRDTGNSGIPATVILASKWRGNSDDYWITMAGFLIPRAIWPGKPNIWFNIDITEMLTGKRVGFGTSIITSTMLGEAWYYFGIWGTVWLMVMFGFTAFALERFLTGTVELLGLYFTILYTTFILIRSTFLTYYQTGVIMLVIGLIWLAVKNMLYKRSA